MRHVLGNYTPAALSSLVVRRASYGSSTAAAGPQRPPTEMFLSGQYVRGMREHKGRHCAMHFVGSLMIS